MTGTKPPKPVDDPSVLMLTARGAGWAIGWRMTTRLLGMINTFVLVRLLVPSEFGLVALAASFAQGLAQLSALGIDEALIREHAPTRETYDTAFTIALIRGAVNLAILLALAWPASQFFNDDRLFAVLIALALAAFVLSFENVGTVEFRRNFNFDQEFKLLVLPRVASIAVTVAVGFATRSHWALVAGIATNQVLGIAMGYAMHPFRPRLSLKAWRQLAHFSFWSWTISTAIMIRDRVDNFVIGRVMTLTDVGIYSVGLDVGTIPTYELAGPLSRACLPGFAATRREGGNTADSYQRIMSSVTLAMLPAGFGISLVADQAVQIALGSQWVAAVPLMRVIGIAGVTYVLGTVTSALLAAHAMLRLSFLICLVSMLVRVVSMVIMVAAFGLVGAAVGWAISISVENLMYVVMAFRRFHINGFRYLGLIWRAVLATAAMAAMLYGLGLGWTPIAGGISAALASLALAIPVGAGTYVVTLLALWLLCGRPEGAESDLLLLLRRSAGGIFGRTFR